MKKALELIHESIHQSVQRRAPNIAIKSQTNPRLVAVSKYQPVAKILEAYDLGERHFGENYINELFDKSNSQEIQAQCQDIKWHFIGHLQKNKVNKLLKVPNLYVVESIDSKNLAQLLNQALIKRHQPPSKTEPPNKGIELAMTTGDESQQHRERLKVMIQVNTSGEEAKNGVEPNEFIPLADFIWSECQALELCGIMTIGKLGGWPKGAPNKDFVTLMELRENLCKHLAVEPQFFELSMGMSSDFEEAVELGSTNIRVGTMIFGERPITKVAMEFAVTLDEAWLYVSDADGTSPICYVQPNGRAPHARTRVNRFGKKVMVVAIMTGRGNLPLVRVPPQTKFNSSFYMDNVMIPLVTEWLPRLYPGDDMEKVFIHHDAATSHTSEQTMQELSELKQYFGFDVVKKEDIPPKTPDASPLDFFGFGYLKHRLRTEMHSVSPMSIDALFQLASTLWSQIPVCTISKVFSDWRVRLKMIVDNKGEQIENLKRIHRKTTK